MSVYFAKAGRYVKVGYSVDPLNRMTSVMRNGATRPPGVPADADVELLGKYPGATRDDMAAAGVRIEAVSESDALLTLFGESA